MTRRRVLVLGSVGVIAALALAACAVWPRASEINSENAAKIKHGMTRAEVESILGGPPRFDATGRVSYDLTGIPGVRPISPAMREWTSDEVLVMVWIGVDDRVQRCVAIPVRREESIIVIGRRWLGL
jgi:hypothetical protein